MQIEGPTTAGLMYSDTGGDGPVIVLLHGVLMNQTLWEEVVDDLRDRYRCIVPVLPFGAHQTPMPDDSDLTLSQRNPARRYVPVGPALAAPLDPTPSLHFWRDV